MIDLLLLPMLIAGSGAFIIPFILTMMPYRLPLILIGAALVLFSTYQFGIKSAERAEAVRIAEAKERIRELERRADKVSIQTIIEYRDRIKYIDKIKEVKVTEYITKVDDAKCQINQGFVTHHNQVVDSINTEKPVEIKPSEGDRKPAEQKLSDVAALVNENYSICARNAAKLESLQQWIRDQQKVWKEFQDASN